MTLAYGSKLALKVGSTGWTVGDLDDPYIERLWEQGRYEIADGVLKKMPAAYFDSGAVNFRLGMMIQRWLDNEGIKGIISTEADLMLNEVRVPKVDMMVLVAEQVARQKRLSRERGKPGVQFGRIVVAPELVVESISLGHEKYDEVTKRRWYAEAGVKNFWLLHAYKKSLECLVLDGHEYRVDQSGKSNAVLKPSAFPGLIIRMKDLWE